MTDERTPTATTGMVVLAVDDEAPARAELAWLLSRDDRIGTVLTASDGAEVLRLLESTTVEALFLDIRMPGLDGLDLARVLRRFAAAPSIVFVSAYDEHAVEAFDLRAVDYVMKPVREERLRDAVGRVFDARSRSTVVVSDLDAEASGVEARSVDAPSDETIAVELGGVTRFVKRSDVTYVEAHGDYARLVTADGRHLVRVSLAHLEEQWADAGFVRIHRRWLVAIPAIDEVHSDGGRMSVRVGDAVLAVSRRHTRELRDRLVRSARPGREPKT
jgi:DNA-binding LytR/AlgR family response regulator